MEANACNSAKVTRWKIAERTNRDHLVLNPGHNQPCAAKAARPTRTLSPQEGETKKLIAVTKLEA
jgi:hypothetical protein